MTSCCSMLVTWSRRMPASSKPRCSVARDAAFSTLVTAELLRAFGARSNTRTLRQAGVLSNMPLVLIVLASFALQWAIHHFPALQVFFGALSIALRQWVAWLILGSVPLLVLEVWKVVCRKRHNCMR